MPKMECHISDGPQTPEDVPGFEEPDEDEEYERHRQDEIDQAHASRALKTRHDDLKTKVSTYTKTPLYSYDQRYWWSTEPTAWAMHEKIQRRNER